MKHFSSYIGTVHYIHSYELLDPIKNRQTTERERKRKRKHRIAAIKLGHGLGAVLRKNLQKYPKSVDFLFSNPNKQFCIIVVSTNWVL